MGAKVSKSTKKPKCPECRDSSNVIGEKLAPFSSSQAFRLLGMTQTDRIITKGKCSILLGPTFVEIKESFTKTLLVFHSKNFRIFFYWKTTHESEPC